MLLIKSKCMTVQLWGRNILQKIGLVLYRCFWRVLLSILCVVVDVLFVYASELLLGFIWLFWDKVWLFLVKTGWQPCCVLQQDSILQAGVWATQSSRTPMLDYCFSTRRQNSAVTNSCAAALSLFSSDILTWRADSLYSVQWHVKKGSACRRICILSTNFAKTLVRKHEYDVKLWRHKHRTPQANDHHMPLNETPHETFLRTPLIATAIL